jgi:hypothetical protein
VFLSELDEQGQLHWEETFANGSLAPAKKGRAVGKTKREEGMKGMVVVDGQRVPLGAHLDSASPSEVTLLEATIKNTADVCL